MHFQCLFLGGELNTPPKILSTISGQVHPTPRSFETALFMALYADMLLAQFPRAASFRTAKVQSQQICLGTALMQSQQFQMAAKEDAYCNKVTLVTFVKLFSTDFCQSAISTVLPGKCAHCKLNSFRILHQIRN